MPPMRTLPVDSALVGCPPEDGGGCIATWFECHTEGCKFEDDWE